MVQRRQRRFKQWVLRCLAEGKTNDSTATTNSAGTDGGKGNGDAGAQNTEHEPPGSSRYLVTKAAAHDAPHLTWLGPT
jgi:hypothetical protein